MRERPLAEDVQNKPVGDLFDDLVEQSKAALDSGTRATAELNELKRRADNALDWRKQLERHKWLPLGLAVAGSVVVFLLFTRRN